MKFMGKLLLFVAVFSIFYSVIMEAFLVFTDKLKLDVIVQGCIGSALNVSAEEKFTQDGFVRIDFDNFKSELVGSLEEALEYSPYYSIHDVDVNITRITPNIGDSQTESCDVQVTFYYKFRTSKVAGALNNITESRIPIHIHKTQNLVIYP